MAAVEPFSNSDASQLEEPVEQQPHPKSYEAAVLDPSESPPGAPEKARPEQNGVMTDSSSSTTAGNVNGFPPPKSTKTPKLENMVLNEKHVDMNSEEMLTSVKTDETYEASLKHDEATAPRGQKKSSKILKEQDTPTSKLESGRHAGSG